jgi:hypothetical protein
MEYVAPPAEIKSVYATSRTDPAVAGGRYSAILMAKSTTEFYPVQSSLFITQGGRYRGWQ